MNNTDQKIEELNSDDIERVESQRKWVRGHYTPETEHKYKTIEGKLNLLDTIISRNWIEANETYKLQCLGVTIGDALAQKLGMIWVAVDDEYGRTPALSFSLADTSIIIFPTTMISKRIERGEKVDVRELFDGICEKIKEELEDIAEQNSRAGGE